MPTLRLIQSNLTDNHYRVPLEWEAEGGPQQTATVEFPFSVSAQDQEDIRWYLENYLEFPVDPAPRRAGRVEERMREIGTALFQVVFEGNRDTWQLVAEVRQVLGETRIEIATTVQEAASVPWELLHDPLLDRPWSLWAQAFVRVYSQPRQRPQMPRLSPQAEAIRILLVICRPRERDDVPFRSVAKRLMDSLAQAERESQQYFQIAVLRPPTFEQLTRVLWQAQEDGQPYHVVHFDGHGTYRETVPDSSGLQSMLQGLKATMLAAPRSGKHGYLLFENPAIAENMQLVDGCSLGNLLRETEVPVLILNACRSAHAETPASAEEKTTPATTVTQSPPPVVASDIHSQVYAFGSLAQELMDAGLAGVVAMRYNVYVVTAAQFVGEVYTALLRGHSLGAAVSAGRKLLHDQPMRGLLTPVALQDWLVPVVFEAAEIKLFPPPKKSLRINLPGLGSKKSDRAEESGVKAFNLPPRPDVGFFGRDETLLALDRAFDRHPIALLYAYAGSGKTTVASEFARWYQQTSGVQVVLFTSFVTYKPLLQVLGDFGQVFGEMLQQQAGINWLALELKERREVALQVLQQVPVLWIWDNVEPVTGFPAGSDSAWSAAEQQELVEFLRAAQSSPTQAKFLLTSRREEQAWLGDLPVRIQVPPLSSLERAQLAKALGEKYRQRHLPLSDWLPLLEFSQGNPLTLTVVVGQALRNQLQTPAQIIAFVEQLRAGAAAFSDEQPEQRERSLGASLSYGFAHAFTEEEHKQLAVLYFFQGFVDVDTLLTMGNLKRIDGTADYSLPELQNLTCDSAIHLLNRAAEIGLLTADGGGYYRIHPALPWYFKRLFETYYADKTLAATRAFVEAMGALGNYYHDQYGEGNREVIKLLQAEEANLLQARRLAQTYEWWDALIGTMQGLHHLYAHTGRRVEWAQLVAELVPLFIDSQDNPWPGREEHWGLVTEYRVRLAMKQRQWPDAERLQRLLVAWVRQGAAPFLATPSDSAGRNVIQTLAVSLEQLGHIQRECEQAKCVTAYQEALTLVEQIEDNAGVASCAYNLGHAYLVLPPLRNLDQAAQWYQRSLELHCEDDRLGRGQCYVQLGLVAYERFQEARNSQQVEEALKYYQQALELLPDNAVNDLAVVHNALGLIYMNVGDLEPALSHYQESIRYDEMANDFYSAALTRHNIALAFKDANRLPDALDYAQAALRGGQRFGQGAAKDVEETERLIGVIEERMRG